MQFKLRLPYCCIPMVRSQTHFGEHGDVFVWECPKCGKTAEAVVVYRPGATFGRERIWNKLIAMKAYARNLLPMAPRDSAAYHVGYIVFSRFHGRHGNLVTHPPYFAKGDQIDAVHASTRLWWLIYVLLFGLWILVGASIVRAVTGGRDSPFVWALSFLLVIPPAILPPFISSARFRALRNARYLLPLALTRRVLKALHLSKEKSQD